jgi:hypothetical protein
MRKNQIVGIGIMALLLCYGAQNDLIADVPIQEDGINQEEQVGWIAQFVGTPGGEEPIGGDGWESSCPACVTEPTLDFAIDVCDNGTKLKSLGTYRRSIIDHDLLFPVLTVTDTLLTAQPFRFFECDGYGGKMCRAATGFIPTPISKTLTAMSAVAELLYCTCVEGEGLARVPTRAETTTVSLRGAEDCDDDGCDGKVDILTGCPFERGADCRDFEGFNGTPTKWGTYCSWQLNIQCSAFNWWEYCCGGHCTCADSSYSPKEFACQGFCGDASVDCSGTPGPPIPPEPPPPGTPNCPTSPCTTYQDCPAAPTSGACAFWNPSCLGGACYYDHGGHD